MYRLRRNSVSRVCKKCCACRIEPDGSVRIGTGDIGQDNVTGYLNVEVDDIPGQGNGKGYDMSVKLLIFFQK